MSAKRRLVALLDKRSARRLILSPLTIVLMVVAVLLSPLLFMAAAITDVAKRRKRWPRLRLSALVVGALVIETLGMLAALGAWVISGFGHAGSHRWRWHLHRGFMGLYTNTMLGLVRRVLGTSIIWNDHGDVAQGPVVLIARHTSFFDALIPATVLCRRNKLLAHHIVTEGLRYSPCIDIVGHRFPNRFIKRSPGEGSSELPKIESIGALLDERSAAIIFPEGTFRNPARFERVVRRISRRQPELAERAKALRHVLPPRANGTYALLHGAPTADVVVCANTGLEQFGSLKQIVDRPYTDKPITVETWRIDRSEIPADLHAFNEWLFDLFVSIDEWVELQA